MNIAERNNKLKHFITCLKCEVSGKCCDDNCSTQYDAGNMGEIIENLEAISKALEQEPRWISITECMPKEREWIGTKRFGTTISDEVYVTFETLDGKHFCDHIRFQNGKLSSSSQISIDAISKGAKPIAWMPLPKPYNAESEADNGNDD